MSKKLISAQKLPQPIVYAGKKIKKKIRQLKRYLKYGSKNFTKVIALPETSFKIVINPSRNACVDEVIAQRGCWETELSQQLANHIKPDSVFVDIGANIGYHSLFVSSLLNNSGEVHAFEPITSLSNQFKESVQINGFTNIEIHTTGLGEKKATVEINLRDENMGGSSLFEHNDLNIVKISGTEKITIKTLDSILFPKTKVSVIKIDVEGYEFEALRGAENILKRDHPVIFLEFSPIFYSQDYPEKSTDFINYLKEIGYSFFTLDGATLDVSTWLEEDATKKQIDIFCKKIE